MSALYAPNGELSALARLHFRDGSTEPLTPAMLMSGALIENATLDAKRRSCFRQLAGEPPGISTPDLLAAFERELMDIVVRLTPGPSMRMLELPPDMDVVKVEILRDLPDSKKWSTMRPVASTVSQRTLMGEE